MSANFAEILARELNVAETAVLGRADSLALPVPVSREKSVCGRPADTLNVSRRAKSLSVSLQEFAKDKDRPWRRDSGIVAGNAATGHLWKSDAGIRGRMSFAAASGAMVDITADPAAARGETVTVSVLQDGRRFLFDVEELAQAAAGPRVSPFQSLECAPTRSANSAGARLPAQCRSYDARALPVTSAARRLKAVS